MLTSLSGTHKSTNWRSTCSEKNNSEERQLHENKKGSELAQFLNLLSSVTIIPIPPY
jgi:hypothetical protein